MAASGKKEHVVCVTGGSGFLGSTCIKILLERGYRVHSTVRDPRNEPKVAHLKALPGAAERLTLFAADLLQEGSFDKAIHGAEVVLHTASPFFLTDQTRDNLVEPAVQGTLNVLRSVARAPSVRRVVLTSSTISVYGHCGTKPDSHVFTEADWSREDLMTERKMWYGLSKTVAEREAWEFMQTTSPHFDLVAMCPTWILGPMLQPALNESNKKIYDYMVGNTPVILNAVKALVDVRDVAMAHIAAFENPQASGRYLLIGACPTEHEIADAVQQACPSAQCVANVVRLAFPSELDPTTHTWDSILTVLNRHATELNLLQPLRSELLHEHYQGAWVSGLHGGPPPAAELELERTLSALCIGAFKGAQQASFINDVLSFSEHIQLTLFTLLRDDEDSEPATHSDRTVTPATTTTGQHHHDTPPPSTPVQSTRHTPTTSATTPASSLSCSKNETKRMARENHILKDENAALQRELVQVKAAMATLHDEEESRKGAFENLKLELRVEAAKNERTIKKQVDEYVAHLQAELSSATAKLASLSGIEKELEAARDELDILKPAADKAIKLEARVEKYQAKLDDMTRIKEANRV
ncbi:hypothetical protein DYB36_000571 [Aphanomyces astaci]|uniref:NAD-dependent epimerase/dehydratase domain-containing protein n=1 Tax=Aphanomyces astaci TaxID=112090 RepID=A0A397A1T8_APHAT|nr:hypothetical protein DYB36_000571 [Aphanomyces astaci]RHZ32561.1 hypothetical protein DYB31_005782 [Aphanomyces astaci]